MEAKTVKTELVETSRLMASFKNPRKIDERALKELMGKIQNDPLFLLQRPILCNEVNGRLVVYAGTQRFIACKELGLKKVPVRIEKNLDKEQLDYRMLLDNVSRGEFDETVLVSEFAKELETIQNADTFKDIKFKFGAEEKEKGGKLVYLKLVFQTREQLNLLYALLDDLQEKYPNESVSQRLFLYLEQESETVS